MGPTALLLLVRLQASRTVKHNHPPQSTTSGRGGCRTPEGAPLAREHPFECLWSASPPRIILNIINISPSSGRNSLAASILIPWPPLWPSLLLLSRVWPPHLSFRPTLIYSPSSCPSITLSTRPSSPNTTASLLPAGPRASCRRHSPPCSLHRTFRLCLAHDPAQTAAIRREITNLLVGVVMGIRSQSNSAKASARS